MVIPTGNIAKKFGLGEDDIVWWSEEYDEVRNYIKKHAKERFDFMPLPLVYDGQDWTLATLDDINAADDGNATDNFEETSEETSHFWASNDDNTGDNC